jgi:hypothetical protein
MLPPRSFASRNSLPPEGAAAPADGQSQIRGPCLLGKPDGHPLRMAPCPHLKKEPV